MKSYLLLGLLVLSNNVFAASKYTGTINRMVCHSTGISPLCQVGVNGTPTGETCGTSGWKYTFDATTLEGKNLYSMLLAAQIGKQVITLAGTGSCNLSNSSEDLRHAYLTTG